MKLSNFEKIHEKRLKILTDLSKHLHNNDRFLKSTCDITLLNTVVLRYNFPELNSKLNDDFEILINYEPSWSEITKFLSLYAKENNLLLYGDSGFWKIYSIELNMLLVTIHSVREHLPDNLFNFKKENTSETKVYSYKSIVLNSVRYNLQDVNNILNYKMYLFIQSLTIIDKIRNSKNLQQTLYSYEKSISDHLYNPYDDYICYMFYRDKVANFDLKNIYKFVFKSYLSFKYDFFLLSNLIEKNIYNLNTSPSNSIIDEWVNNEFNYDIIKNTEVVKILKKIKETIDLEDSIEKDV